MYETLDEYSLINNGLKHVVFELEQESTSYARVVRELHQIFFRFMIAALKGTANIFVLEGKFKDGPIEFQRGTGKVKKIEKGPKVKGCSKVWRFTDPVEIEDFTPKKPEIKKKKGDEKRFVIRFYSALARVQSEAFMNMYVASKTLKISDKEMKIIEWVHENVRNEYEHFEPKSYSIGIESMEVSIELLLRLINDLLYCGNLFIHESQLESIEANLKRIHSLLSNLV